MKKLSTLFVSLLVLAALGAPVMAKTCPKLVHQIDEKMASMQMPADKAAEIKKMRDEGEQLHKAGKHAESEKILREALAKLGM